MPGEYLEDYYAVVEPDEVETIAFFADAIRDTRPQAPILFFGTGPTLHHVFLSADRASEIHLADYLPQNLAEIERWLARDADAHDWRPFVRYTLECEGLDAPTEAQLARREELTRAKVTRLLQADAGDREPLGERYATVVSAYCADSATADRATWETYMRHIAGLVEPGGVFITAALRRSRSYLVGGKRFPSADVDEHDLRAVLEPEFDCAIEVREVPEHARLGYAGIVLATASRRRPASAPARARRRSDRARPPAISRASASSSGGRARAAVGERERVLGRDRDAARVAVAALEAGALDQPRGGGLDAPVGLREARRAAVLGGARLERRERVRLEDRVREERAGGHRVGVGRVEHHALAAAQRQHRLADVGERRPLPRLRPRACARARRRSAARTARGARARR